MKIKTPLIEELHDELNELGKTTVGTDEYKITVDGVTKLADRIIEIEKIEAENRIKMEAQEAENEIKLRQLKDEERDRRIKNIIAVGTFVSSIAVYGLTYLSSMKYEDKGVIPTTEGAKNALRQLFKLKS